MLKYKLHTFENKQSLAKELAKNVANQLSIGIDKKGSANLALSGGLTPKIFLEELSVIDIDWSKILVNLVDERSVPFGDPRSNKTLISKYFLKNKAKKSSFIDIYYPDKTLKESIKIANNNIIRSIGFPFDAVVLGMGTDGHTASFFPKGDTLSIAIDSNTPRSVIAIKNKSNNEQRVTFSLSALCDAKFLSLHIEGMQKKNTLEKALSGDNIAAMPIRAILLNSKSHVEIYWTPAA
ncbi:6-phosphogluconolactonase [Candidatus Liberibacter americanus]|uniref:6-phosphogluconolactonase n=1 Tax=Candidatus Liberibacter americanus str. Sao Paulo TaxID=1261131 RepID=U6B4E9_9HYPH|nr:6-phosphogluconolactonase [Candidatus Liberibacter americanus]AHA27770.1 6-phosphogluconolactonase/Glucosamine-6-phosphate isomerase/deaminase [Candidatus Liberibacter americanus str. Sao Paulo]EMS36155.1 6-phosphogluconolactonase [Candidatus Liberibacter americanus PW_SP]